MEAVTPWRGSREVHALWIEHGVPDAAGRVLALWRSGCTVANVEGGWLVRLARTRRMDAGTAPGLVLLERAGALLGADTAGERGTLVLPREGRLVRLSISTLQHVDVAAWLEVDGLVLAKVRSLGAPPVAAVVLATPDARQVLGRPALTGEGDAVARSLSTSAELPGEPPWWVPLAAGAIGWLRRWTGASPPRGSPSDRSPAGDGPTDPDAPPPEAKPPNAFQQWLDRVSAALLGSLMDGRHGRYLSELVDLFESDDLDKALRHAIPLGGEASAAARPSFGVPSPRRDLSIHPGRRATSVVAFREDAVSGLRAMYLRAAERLLRSGKVHDAVFVYVELLKDPDRAIALLEKHEEYALAAKIADASARPPELRIRLWIRANRLDRAIEIARETHTFVAVIAALQRADPETARVMRRAWAQHLAALGDFAQATTVAWVDPTLRPMAVPWLDAAITESTPAGAALVALLLRQTPETFEIAKERVDALLTGTTSDRVRLRMALADGLFAEGGAHGAALVRSVVRVLLQDLNRFPEVVPAAWLRKLGGALREPALAHDLPRLDDSGEALRARAVPLMIRFARGDVGAAPVADVAWMDDGAVLVALDQLGVRAYDAQGRERARFDAPASELVVHRGSARALALQRRPFGVSVTRLDLIRRAATPWHDAPYGQVAHEIHHGFWMVSTDGALLALDVAADEAKASWRLNDVGLVWDLVAGAQHVGAVVGDERWVFDARPIQLRHRLPGDGPASEEMTAFALDPTGRRHMAQIDPPDLFKDETAAPVDLRVAMTLRPTRDNSASRHVVVVPGLPSDRWISVRLAADEAWRVVTLRAPDRCVLLVIPVGGSHAVMVVALEGATRAVVRVARLTHQQRVSEHLVVGDDLGRVLAFDLATGRCVRDVRIQ